CCATAPDGFAVCSAGTRRAPDAATIGEPAMTRRLSAPILPPRVAASCLSSLATGRAQQQGANQPGTKWTEEQLRQAIELARVGRKLTPKSCPGGHRVARCPRVATGH